MKFVLQKLHNQYIKKSSATSFLYSLVPDGRYGTIGVHAPPHAKGEREVEGDSALTV